MSEPLVGTSGLIFDIQRFSVHDGPGIRTLVFFKGCPLACLWCSNPESQRGAPELLVDASKCVACGGCVEVCPHGAVRRSDNAVAYERARCTTCGRCAETCPAEVRTLAGRWVTAEEVAAEVAKDAPFFTASGGGVTLGGGEPLAQADFAQAVLRSCRLRGIQTAIETCGHVPWPAIETVLPFTDLFLYDVKHLDPARHKAQTGGDVVLVLANLQRLAGSGARTVVRVPVVPGFNDGREEIRAIAVHVAQLGIRELHLLPHHRLGDGKYRLLGRPIRFPAAERISGAHIQGLKRAAETAGVIVKVGG